MDWVAGGGGRVFGVGWGGWAGDADGPECHVTDRAVNQHSCSRLLSRKQMPGRAQAQPEE